MRRLTVAAAAAGLLAAGGAAHAQQQPAPVVRVNAMEITLGGRVHMQLNTSSAEGVPTGELLLRRVGLGVLLKVNEAVSGTIAADFGGERAAVVDAFMRVAVAPRLEVFAGRAHRPFSRLTMTSSNRILPIERGLRIRGVAGLDQNALVSSLRYADRDVGVQVAGSLPGLPGAPAVRAGVFRGPLHGAVGPRDTYQLVARVTASASDKLKLGAAWSGRDFSQREVAGADTTFSLRGGSALEIDAEWGTFAPGLHVIAEASRGDADPHRGTRFTGAQGWLAYRTRELTPTLSGLEAVLRCSWSEVTGGAGPGIARGGTLLTPGVNVYLGGLNRFMLNYDHWIPQGGGGPAGSAKAMFSLVF